MNRVGWIEIALLLLAAALLIGGLMPRLRAWRALLWGGCALMLISAAFPRSDNALGQYLFIDPHGVARVPSELFGIAWWVLGAWLLKSLLDLALRRTLFPNDNEPHARRLLADLASGMIYVLGFVGIMTTVFRQPLSGLLATSGVLAIVIGLALQNTLADVFSGLALNIERPYSAGDWIAVSEGVEGQVIEINWRATRIRSASNVMFVIPNSVVAKAVVTNRSRLREPYLCALRVKFDQSVAAGRVIELLRAAASGCQSIAPGTAPTAFATRFDGELIEYELDFASPDYLQAAHVQSDVLECVLQSLGRESLKPAGPTLQLYRGPDAHPGPLPRAAATAVPGSGQPAAAAPAPPSPASQRS